MLTRPHRRLLPRRLVSPLAGVAGACLSLAALLAAYTRGRRATWVDLRVDDWLRPVESSSAAALDAVVEQVEPTRMLTLCLLLGLATLLAGRWRAALLCVTGPPLALALTALGKELFGRPSATIVDNFEAYPSGHTAGVCAFAALVVVVSLPGGPLADWLSPWSRAALWLGAGMLTAVTALALTALRHHYVTDVVGGAALSAGAVLLTAAVLQRLEDRVLMRGPLLSRR